jgi:hypothetical protein
VDRKVFFFNVTPHMYINMYPGRIRSPDQGDQEPILRLRFTTPAL